MVNNKNRKQLYFFTIFADYTGGHMKTVLLLSNHHLYTYNLRKEIIKELIQNDYRVVIAVPYGEKVELLKQMGCEHIDVPLIRRSTNPLVDLKLFLKYRSIIRKYKPDLVLTYTIKPNLYGGLACRLKKTTVIHTVTGLGSIYIRNIWYKTIVVNINKIAFKKSSAVFFMNEDNEKLYRKLSIINADQKTIIVPGSGVNLDNFAFHKYPISINNKFTFIARILRDKGIEEFLYAARKVKKLYPNTIFEVVGFVDEKKYQLLLNEYQNEGIINYLGLREDIIDVIRESHCVVLPSYGEGRGTILQEAASLGRPLITTDIYGCKDNVDDGVNGFLCNVKDSDSLADAMIKFLKLSYQQKVLFGINSRIKAELEFDRKIVVKKYMDFINHL